MAMNLDAVLKIAAKVTGEEGVKKLAGAIATVEDKAEGLKKSFKSFTGSALFQGMAVAAASLTAALGLSVKRAIDFESALADVRKVVDGLDTPAGMQALQQEIFDLSRQLPITATGFAQMYAAAGQAGIPRQELRQFAEDVAKVAVAFDMTAEEAGTAMAKLRTNLGLAQPELMLLADAINTLSNNMPATAREITEFALRAATAGKAAGLSAEQTVAFGAAMIASGAQSEVAATSFNNMIRALSRGASMTERQVSALVTLGYATKDSARYERELTAAVERESSRRMRAIEDESDAAIKEIRRRYREIERITNEQFDDEALAFQRSQEDRYDALTRNLQRMKEAELASVRDRAGAEGQVSQAVINAIEDRYDRQLTLLRRQQEDESRAYDRQQQSRLQQIQDQQEDQQELEMAGVKARFDALRQEEEARKQLLLAEAKKTAAELGAAMVGPEMAKRLQQDAVGTIKDVFNRIRKLPEEMQMSVVSDLFGDEARALLPLIKNAQLLDRAIELVGNKQQYAGSTAKEFASRAATTANQLQLMRNQLDELAITAGANVLPALKLLLEVLDPLAKAFNAIAKIPVIGPAFVGLSAAFIGFVAIAPALPLIVKGFTMLGTAMGWILSGKAAATVAGFLGIVGPGLQGLAATVAGTLGIVGPALAAIGGAFQGLMTTLIGIFSGPIGWAALIGIALVAIWAFRDQIGQALQGIAVAFQLVFSQLFDWLKNLFSNAGPILRPLIDGFRNAWDTVIGIARFSLQTIAGIVGWFGQTAIAILYQAFVQPWINLWNNVLRGPVIALVNWVAGVWGIVAEAFVQNAVIPIQRAWSDLVSFFNRAASTIGDVFRRAWSGITTWFQSAVVSPIQRMWEGLMTAIPRAINQAGSAIRSWWQGIINNMRTILNGFLRAVVNAFNTVANLVNRAISAFNALRGPDIPLVPLVSAPAFAEGGYVNRPTLGLIGEAGEGEYIIPESKMAQAAANFLAGSRGRDVIPTSPGTATASVASPVINITTGPVVEFDGKRYVSVADLERAMRITADGVIGRLRTPSARIALGMSR